MLNIKKIALLLLGVLSCCFSLSAQQSPKPYLLHWTEKDGLADNNVYKVIKDRRGYLWIGTSNGLCRFDGKDFEIFRYDPKNQESVAANEVVRLLETSDGKIWAGTDGGGLSIYDYHTQRFQRLRQNLEQPYEGLAEDRIYSILEGKNQEVLLGYRAIGSGKGGLTVLSKDLKIKKHLLQEVTDYAGFPMKVTRILASTKDEGIYWLAGRSFFKWNRNNNQIDEFPHPSFSPNHTSISGIMEDSDSTLLVGIYFDGLWLFDKKNNQWKKKIHEQPVQAFLRAKDGKVWLADNQGIGWLAPGTNQIHYEILLSGDKSPFDTKVIVGDIDFIEDNLWISTNKGLFCWSYMFQQFNIRSLEVGEGELAYYPEFIGALQTNEWLFLDRNRGLVITDSLLLTKQLIPMPRQQRLRKAALSKHPSGVKVLLGAEQGLYLWEPGNAQIKALASPPGSFQTDQIQAWSIYMDQHHHAWVGTRTSGLLKIDLSTQQTVQFLHDPQDSNSLCHNKYLFEIDRDAKGNLWVGTDKGLSIIDPKTDQFITNSNLAPLQNYVLHALELDKQGKMWIGSRDQGLFRYDLTSQELVNYTTSDGLLYNGVNEIIREDSIIWLATRQGLCNINTSSGQIISFDQKKGIYNNTLYDSRLSRLPNGEIMLTYQKSPYFSVFRHHQLKAYFSPPELVIQTVRILSGNENKTLIVKGQNLQLEPDENYFAIDFQAIHFLQAKGMIYEYQLEEYDKDWILAGNTNTAVYTNLPGGQYRFKVRAANQDRHWSKEQVLFIDLKTPWYKTIWAYSLFALLLGGVVYTFYQLRTRQIRKEEYFKRQLAETEMIALRAQINPHFIFNCLNSIKSYIIDNRIEDGTEFVGRFSQLIRMILNHSKERLIPISKEIEAIRLYVWLEQERLKHQFNVDFQLSFDSSTEELKIPPLLFQPYIENAIWHGLVNRPSKGNLGIQIEEQAENILIQISDDGIGRTAAMELKRQSIFSKPSLGLELSHRRLAQINELYQMKAQVQIEDQFPGADHPGTVVRILFPKIKTPNYA